VHESGRGTNRTNLSDPAMSVVRGWNGSGILRTAGPLLTHNVHCRGSLQLGFALKLRGLNVTPAPLLPIAALRCSTIAGNQLDQIGLAGGGGFLKQAVKMCSDRGLDDAEHTGDLGHAVHLDDGKKHAQFRRG
jgi:hypothetical protein